MAVLSFYIQVLRKYLAHHKPMMKLVAFKLVVGLGFIQSVGLSSMLRKCLS